jgi:2-hydroxy-3-oxopropionate reductase
VSKTIGFIGLGIMGKPMATNLLKAGYSLVVYDVVAAPVDELASHGAAIGKSAKDVASRSDMTITMLPDGPDVEEAVLGPNGAIEGARKGSTIVDMSSISPKVAQEVGAACAKAGVGFLDAPVSGGEPRAIDGTLAIMVGGEASVFEQALPVFHAMGSKVTLTGPVGAGNVTKLANQIMVACNLAAMGEALALATRAGLDPQVVFEAVKDGLAGSNVLNAKAPLVIARNFQPGGRIKTHHKDLKNALHAAEEMNMRLPMTATAQGMILSLIAQGNGDLDHSAIVMAVERYAGVQISRPAEHEVAVRIGAD